MAKLLSPGLSLYSRLRRAGAAAASADAAEDAPPMLNCDAKPQNLENLAQETENRITEDGKAGSFAAGDSECAGGGVGGDGEHHKIAMPSPYTILIYP